MIYNLQMEATELKNLLSKYPYLLKLPAWQRFLLYLHNQDGFSVIIRTSDPYLDSVLQLLKFDVKKDYRCLADMVNRHILTQFSDRDSTGEYSRYSFGKDGFPIAQDIVKHNDSLNQAKIQERIQKGIFVLSIAIALNSLFSIGNYILDNPWVVLFVLILVLIIVVLVFMNP